MRRAFVVACLVALMGSPSSAEDAKPAAPPKDGKPAEPAGMSSPAPAPAPAAKPAPSPTPEQAADAVLAAIKAKDDAALKVLAAKDDPDPWRVADELIGRGELDAAEAFAKAASRVDTEALPGYVASRRGRPDDPARRERLAKANAALTAGTFGEALETLGSEETGAFEGVVGIRLAMVRGISLRALARLDAAAAAFLSAGEAAERLGWLARAAQAFHESSVSAYGGSAFAAAQEAAMRALSICERRGDKAGAAATLTGIGYLHCVLGDFEKALSFYERALAAKEALGDEAGAAGTLGDIGVAHYRLGDYERALSFGERALQASVALEDRPGMAGAWVNIGVVHAARGDFAQALDCYERGLALAESIGHRQWAANALGNIATVHVSLGDYTKALSFHERALAAKEALGDKAGAAATLGNIGTVHAALGEFAKALSIYERALAMKEAVGDKPAAADTLGNIGVAHSELGDYAKALSFLERALAAKEALGDRLGVATGLANLGNVYFYLGDYARALSTWARALSAQEAVGDKAGAATALANIGNGHLALGEHAKGLSAYVRALSAMEALGDRAGAARALGAIGNAYNALGDPAKALSFVERALAAKEALGDKAGAAWTLCTLGRVHLALGDFPKASSSLERAARSARRLRAVPLLVEALKGLAVLHLAQGSPGRALSVAQQALRESETLLGGLGDEEGALARAKQTDLFEVGAIAAAREGNLGEAFSFLENGRAGALLDSLDKRDVLRWKAETLPQELRAAEAKARADEKRSRAGYEKALAGDSQASRTAIAAAARALDDALEDARAVNGRIQRETKRAAGLFYPRARTLEEVQETLEVGETLLLYGLCFDEALVLVVGREEARVVWLGQRADVEAACEALDARDPDSDPTAALAALRKALVEPLGLKEDVKRVVVSPAGPLALLPYGALFDVPVAVTPSGSTQALLLEEERGRGEGILALGNPDYAGATKGTSASAYRGRPLAALPATRAEAEAIATSGALLGAKASEAGLREALGASKHWRAVHLACHGLVDGKRPLQSSLALTRAGDDDGFLTAQEVLSMRIPSDLVTLSACETATGDVVSGEGILGLTRAFMYAGTPRVLCSLWKVDDQATAALMTKFYELWNPKDGKPGLSTAEALRQAQAFVRSQEKWKHPYYWAAWVLWGLPS